MPPETRRDRVTLGCIALLAMLVSFDIYLTITRSDQSANRGFSIIESNIRIEQALSRLERNQSAILGAGRIEMGR